MSEQLTSQLAEVCQAHGLPSLAVTVFDKDRVLDQAAVGVRKLGESMPITVADLFHIGSNGKAMTATIIGQLVENGRLSWHSTPLDIFPDWQPILHPDFHNITLIQLLSHQAGLPPFEEDVEFEALPNFEGTPAEIRASFAKHILANPPIHPPGNARRYSNAGFTVATALAEAVADEPWESMIHTMILEPLEMRGGVGWPAKFDPAQPWGHHTENGSIEPHDPNGAYQLEPTIAPAGDVYVAFNDYTKFLQMNLKALAGEETIFPAEMIRFLHTRHGDTGLGWGVQPFLEQTVSAHTGSADTFFTLAMLVHGVGIGFSMTTNITWEVAEKPCVALLKELFSQYLGENDGTN